MEDKLAAFGKEYMHSVRDWVLHQLDATISGTMKGDGNHEWYSRIKDLSDKDQDLLRDFGCRLVDLTLHHTLFMLETSENWMLTQKKDSSEDIAALSDGLSGELYTEDGWIARFSKYPISKTY